MSIVEQINDLSTPPVFIAEMSCNHLGDKSKALEIIQAAKFAGADVVKLQTYTSESLTFKVDKPDFVISGGLWDGKKYFELYDIAKTPFAWHQDLFREAQNLGLGIFSTPFSEQDVNFLEQFQPECYKVASFENVHLELLKKIAETKKPVIISNGMSTLEEIVVAVNILKDFGCPQVIVLKCCSAYPAPFNEMNLSTMSLLRNSLGLHIGLSDHSHGHVVPVVATALGARVIEKHLIISRNRDKESFDSAFSMEPKEFSDMVKACKEVFYNKVPVEQCAHYSEILGQPVFGPKPGSQEERSLEYRRSIYVSKNIKVGEVFTANNLSVIRPGYGLHPHRWLEVLGKKSKKTLEVGDRLTIDCF